MIYEEKMIDLKKLCIEIATTEDGDDVKGILENYSLWNDRSCWKAVGSKGDDDKNDGKNDGMERVEEDRSNAVEAAIVRIMKARRSLNSHFPV